MIFLAVTLLAVGCARPVDPDRDESLTYHVGMARAYYRLSDYPRAVEMYAKALELNPADAEVCLQLGIIYQDNLKDTEKAAAYYREFLRLSPDSQKAELVRGWLKKSEQSEPLPPFSPSPLRITPVPVRAPSPPVPPALPPAPGPETVALYTVAKGDTLAGIAERFYGSRTRWQEIFEANRGTLEAPEKLKIGQVLRIPNPSR